MIRLFYSGGVVIDEFQSDVKKSLGGFISSVFVPNNKLNNLFNDLSGSMRDDGVENVLALFLKNESPDTITSLNFYFELQENNTCVFEIAAVAVDQDVKYMEKIYDSNSSPYNAVFTSASLDNQVQLNPSLEAGQYMGIWLKRIPVPNSGEQNCQFISDQISSEQVGLNFSWS